MQLTQEKRYSIWGYSKQPEYWNKYFRIDIPIIEYPSPEDPSVCVLLGLMDIEEVECRGKRVEFLINYYDRAYIYDEGFKIAPEEILVIMGAELAPELRALDLLDYWTDAFNWYPSSKGAFLAVCHRLNYITLAENFLLILFNMLEARKIEFNKPNPKLRSFLYCLFATHQTTLFQDRVFHSIKDILFHESPLIERGTSDRYEGMVLEVAQEIINTSKLPKELFTVGVDS